MTTSTRRMSFSGLMGHATFASRGSSGAVKRLSSARSGSIRVPEGTDFEIATGGHLSVRPNVAVCTALAVRQLRG